MRFHGDMMLALMLSLLMFAVSLKLLVRTEARWYIRFG